MVHRSFIYEKKSICIWIFSLSVIIIPKTFVQQLSVGKINVFLAEFPNVKFGVLPATVMPIILAHISLWNTGICRLRAIIEL